MACMKVAWWLKFPHSLTIAQDLVQALDLHAFRKRDSSSSVRSHVSGIWYTPESVSSKGTLSKERTYHAAYKKSSVR